MPKYIIEHVCKDGIKRYLIWSTIVDAPLTYGCSLAQIFEQWRAQYGERGVETLRSDLDRHGFDALDRVVGCNRAGKDETRISKQQIIDHYFERQGALPVGVPWMQGDN